MAVVEDFEEIAFYLIAERSEAEVVDNEELCFGEAPEEAALLLERLGFREFVHEPREAEIPNRKILSASGVGEGTGDVALTHAGGAADEDIGFARLCSFHASILVIPLCRDNSSRIASKSGWGWRGLASP